MCIVWRDGTNEKEGLQPSGKTSTDHTRHIIMLVPHSHIINQDQGLLLHSVLLACHPHRCLSPDQPGRHHPHPCSSSSPGDVGVHPGGCLATNICSLGPFPQVAHTA